MKTSLLTKKANSRRILLIRRTILSIVVLVVLALSAVVLPIVLRTMTAIVWYPFDAVRVWVAESGSSLPQYIRERNTLLAELETYKVADATSRGNESTIKKLQIENDEFRKQLGAVPQERLLARVVARPNQLPYDMLMLDRGTEHGVVVNAPVFVGKDQVIGFISSVEAQTSLVTLLSTPGFTASAYVFGPNIYTVTEGMGGGILRVRVPQGILLQPHNIVVLPAIDSGVYGEVAYVEAAPSQPEQYGYVRTSVPLQSLYYVSIGRQPIVTHTFEEAKTVVSSAANKLFTVAVPASELVVPESYQSLQGSTTSSTATSGATSTVGARATTTH
jgi:cell shape-determining protein MreC